MKSRVSLLSAGTKSFLSSGTYNFMVAVLVIIGIAGCNPYNSEFNCKGAPFGSCSPTPEVYKDILEHKDLDQKPEYITSNVHLNPDESTGATKGDKDKVRCTTVPELDSSGQVMSAYREAELTKITKLLKQPVTPIVNPPKVMRILFMPYESEDGMLNMPEYAYIMLDKPKWVMGDYLIQKNGDR